MATLHDMVVSTITLMVTIPFSLAKLSCIVGIRSIFIIIVTWTEMLRAAICFQLAIFWRIIVLAIAVLSLPVRALTALQREKMVEICIQEMQMELDNLVWNRKKLDEQLKSAIKERRLVEALLAELEDEHEEVICKMELLEDELDRLKAENQQLKETQGKSIWSSKVQCKGSTDDGQHVKDGGKSRTSLPRSGRNEDDYAGEGMKNKANPQDEEKNGLQIERVNKSLLGAEAHFHDTNSLQNQMNSIVVQRREIARSRSFFSALLSLLVGFIIWEAKDPCMPLIIALFAVAFISLITVLTFLSTIGNKPAMDAVALLSFNWFILGLFAYPTLPMLVHSLLPLVISVLEKVTK